MSLATPVVDSWDGANRRIYLKQGVDAFHWIDDIYIEYRNERRLTEAFRVWNPFMVASGNVSKGLGKATPRLLTLLEGTKVIPYDEAGEIQVSGEAITDNADVDASLFDISPLTNPVIINYQPPSAEVIVVDAVAKALDYRGFLYYDENNINGTGQVHPVGTSANPVNNVADGLAIALEYHLIEVLLESDVTMTQDVSNFSITGLIPDIEFKPMGFKAHLCSFKNLNLNGDFNDSLIHVNRCDIIEALNVYGEINDSYHSGKILISANQTLKMADCESGIAGFGSPELDMHQGEDTTYSGRNISGGFTLTNCDTPACVTTISFADGGKPHLEPSCTDGFISVRGLGLLDDRSYGSTIDTTAWLDTGKFQSISDGIDDIKNDLGIPVTPPVKSKPYLDDIEAQLKTMYIDENQTYKVKLNQTYIDGLKIELNDPILNYIPTSKGLITPVLDNSFVDDSFAIHGEVK